MEAANQSIVDPEAGVALIITVPVPHLDPTTPAVGTAGATFTVAITRVLVEDKQVVPIRDSA